jgi:hypothetical protein
MSYFVLVAPAELNSDYAFVLLKLAEPEPNYKQEVA